MAGTQKSKQHFKSSIDKNSTKISMIMILSMAAMIILNAHSSTFQPQLHF